jgi:hypothetical protein
LAVLLIGTICIDRMDRIKSTGVSRKLVTTLSLLLPLHAAPCFWLHTLCEVPALLIDDFVERLQAWELGVKVNGHIILYISG